MLLCKIYVVEYNILNILLFKSSDIFVIMNIEAVIFDMNGVIIDDEPLHDQATKDACKMHGYDVTAPMYEDIFMGRTTQEGFTEFCRRYNPDVSVEQLVREKTDRYMQIIPGNLKEVPYAIDLIGDISGEFLLGLASSATSAEVSMVLSNLHLHGYFSTIVSSEDVDNGKPDPEPYLITAVRLGMDPRSCLVIEDSKNGVIAAKEAGMYCVGFQNPTYNHGSGKMQDLSRADVVISSLGEMEKILEKLKN